MWESFNTTRWIDLNHKGSEGSRSEAGYYGVEFGSGGEWFVMDLNQGDPVGQTFAIIAVLFYAQHHDLKQQSLPDKIDPQHHH